MLYEKHETRIRAVLEHLSAKGAQRHCELMRLWMQNNGTLSAFSHTLNWLKRKGYIKNVDKAYEITDGGKKYLEGLRA